MQRFDYQSLKFNDKFFKLLISFAFIMQEFIPFLNCLAKKKIKFFNLVGIYLHVYNTDMYKFTIKADIGSIAERNAF